jgi:hypothetical protein
LEEQALQGISRKAINNGGWLTEVVGEGRLLEEERAA